MNFSSLNVDVLLYLMGFIKPVDQFNLLLSGILRGFEDVVKGIILRERYCEHFTSVSSCSHSVICPESIIVDLYWGYAVVAHPNWKLGESPSINK